MGEGKYMITSILLAEKRILRFNYLNIFTEILLLYAWNYNKEYMSRRNYVKNIKYSC